VWAFHGTTADTEEIEVPLSFSIPLAGILGKNNVFIQEVTEPTLFAEKCPAVSPFAPEATTGNLCVYVIEKKNVTITTEKPIRRPGTEAAGTATSGAVIHLNTPTGAAFAAGTFAVMG
jgi:hypothetical protein